LLPKIPPRVNRTATPSADLPDLSESRTSQTSRGRNTQNSVRAGTSPGIATTYRARSQEPLVRRKEQRILASQSQAARRNPDIENQPLLNQHLDTIIEMTGPTGVSSETVASSSGTRGSREQVATTYSGTGRKMPKPGERNAPTFDVDKPEELSRFFDRVEDWFEDENILDDTEKKKKIVRYLDPDSEMQWKAMSKFADGTFDEFKAQIMASYPAAEDVMRGSVSALKRKIGNIGPVVADDKEELLKLIRVMRAEVIKLKNIQPPIHTNRELVDLFLGRLTPDFAARVANKLSVHRLINNREVASHEPARNTEDMYDIEDVMVMARHTALEHANPFGKYLGTMTGPMAETSVKLEEAMARLTDTVNIQVQHNKQVDQRLASLQNYMVTSRTQAPPPQTGPPQVQQQGYNRSAPNQAGQPPQNQNCYYCDGPHRIAECTDALRHMDLKWVVRVDGRLRYPDGRRIQKEYGKTMKETVELENKPVPGIVPTSKIKDATSLYQGMSSVASYVHTQLGPGDQARILTDLIEKIGVDQVQQYLGDQDQIFLEEDDGSVQNFDRVR
jgi:hypothetical protein